MAARVPYGPAARRTRAGQEFRRCLGRFATGVTVVTMEADDQEHHGLTVNSLVSVSLNPALVLISISKTARGHDLLRGRPFAVNILRGDSEGLARHFAGQRVDSLAVHWVQGFIAPRLAGTLAYIECAPWAQYDGGDHTLYVGEVFDCGRTVSGDALVFFEGRFAILTLEREMAQSSSTDRSAIMARG